MKIDLQRCIEHQKHLDFHPDFWKKPEEEILKALENRVIISKEWTEKLQSLENLTKSESKIVESCKYFLEIALD